jgi:hypothetical protein
MFKKFTLALAALCVVASATFTNGPCGSATIDVGKIEGRVQCNYKHQASQHFSLAGGVQKLIVYSDDFPHSEKTVNGKDPRTEVTLKARPHGNNDVAEFEGEFMVTGDTSLPFALF